MSWPDRDVLVEILRRTFESLDKKALASCPDGCLAVLWFSEKVEEP